MEIGKKNTDVRGNKHGCILGIFNHGNKLIAHLYYYNKNALFNLV